jgi:nucleoid-associated protein YejK
MPVEINQLIIHELLKEADSSEAKVFLTEEAIPLDEKAQGLIEKLNQTFVQKEDTLQGYLNSPEDALFPGYVQLLTEQQLSSSAFMDFSRDTMSALQLALQGVVGAKGGYLVYADYTEFESRILAIFLVRDTEGLVFEKKEADSAFALNPVTYLNTEKLAMACRIRLDRYEAGTGRYVELIKHAKSQKEISEYFINWIGLDRPETSKELTHSFLEMVSELPLPVDDETGEVMPESQFREQVLNFAMSSPQKTINIKEFDKEFYGDAKAVENFMENNGLELEQEFRYDKSTMKKYYNYKASAESMYLYFNRKHIQNGQIRIEGENIILHIPELAEQVMDIMGDE